MNTRYVAFCAGCVAASALVGLFSFLSNAASDILVSPRAAAGLIAIGTYLYLATKYPRTQHARRWFLGLALLTMGIGVSGFAFWQVPSSGGAVGLLRATPLTDTTLALVGMGLFSVAYYPKRESSLFESAIGATALTFSLCAGMAYLYNASVLYETREHILMRPLCCLGLSFATFGYLLLRPDGYLVRPFTGHGLGASRGRRLLLFGLVSAAISGWLFVWMYKYRLVGPAVGITLTICNWYVWFYLFARHTAGLLNRAEQENEKAIERIEETTQWWKHLVNNVSEGFIVLDRDFRIACANPTGAAALTNRKATDDVVGKPLDYFAPEVRSQDYFRQLDRVLRDKKPATFLTQGFDKKHYQVAAYPFRDGISIFFRDITESRLQEVALRAQLADRNKQALYFESLLDLMPTPLLLLEAPGGGIVFSNHAAHTLFARWIDPNGHEKLSDVVSSITNPDGQALDPDEMPDRLAACGHELSAREYTMCTALGERSVLMYSKLIPARPGRRPRALLAMLDITYLKTIEEQLKEAIATRDLFTSIAAHELRGPLTGLSLSLQNFRRLQRKGVGADDGNARCSQLVNKIETQTYRLDRLVGDLLDYARLKKGQLSMQFEHTDVTDVARMAIERMEPELVRAGITLEKHLADHLICEADGTRIEQVITNVLSNAIRYAPHAPLEVSTLVEGNNVVIRLTDHGPGIKESDQKRLFMPFQRGGQADKVPGGMGIGLYVAQQIIAAHHGSLTVHDTPEHGATFEIALPLAGQASAPH